MNNSITESEIRLFVYEHFIKHCRPPEISAIAETFNTEAASIQKVLNALEEKHILVLHPDKTKIRMAMPFSAVPTDYDVEIGDQSWHVN